MAEAELKEAKKLLAEAETRELAARLRAVSLRSMKFIADNGIRRSDVQMADDDRLPYFGIAAEFAKWIVSHPPMKRWAEWNGVIYHTTDILMGNLPDMPGRIEDVPE